MSLDATKWAWDVQFPERASGSLKALKRLVLLSLADRAGEDHTCFPSINRLRDDTTLDCKTVMKIIAELIEDGLITDTGERKGVTKQVKVYRLCGVSGRENKTVPTTELFKQESPDLNSTESGTVPTMEQYHSSHERVPTIPPNSPNSGTRNLPKNLQEESKNKKDWLCLKKLREEISLADDSIEAETILNAKWTEREKRAFEIYNQDKSLCDALMNFHFADWLLNAYRSKYSNTEKTGYSKTTASENPKQLSDKQIASFAQKLAHHPEFSSKYSEPGESFEKLAARIAVKLQNPTQAKKWEGYLKQVGFSGNLKEAA
ncbi:MAG: helix-turn-helix domain-containing protein [Moraxellaceae bacterium]|nr:helix-turn-helix domain-containing protein [Moraxellaceae bacterium]